MIDAKDNPRFLNDFLDYNSTIKNRSMLSISEYNYDLKHFLQYLVYVFNNYTLPAEITKNVPNISLDNGIKLIDISKLKVSFLYEVSLDDIHSYLHFLKKDYNLKGTTLARRVASIRSFFKYLTNTKKVLETNPALALDSPKIDKRLPVHLDLEEAKRLLDSAAAFSKPELRSRNIAMITLFLNCGLRLSELVSIDIQHINFNTSTLNVIGKGNKERSIYLNEACIVAINNYLIDRNNIQGIKDKDKLALFISNFKKRISNRAVQATIKELFKFAGLDFNKYSTHKLRHTAATLMYQYGNADIRALQQVLGHESIATTEIYTHINSEQVKKAISNNPLSHIVVTKQKADNRKNI